MLQFLKVLMINTCTVRQWILRDRRSFLWQVTLTHQLSLVICVLTFGQILHHPDQPVQHLWGLISFEVNSSHFVSPENSHLQHCIMLKFYFCFSLYSLMMDLWECIIILNDRAELKSKLLSSPILPNKTRSYQNVQLLLLFYSNY